MASKYSILSVSDISDLVGVDLTGFKDVAGTTRAYSDDQIEAIITHAEEMVFGHVHQTYTSSTIPDDVLSGVKIMAKLMINNMLVADGVKHGEIVDELGYFNDLVLPMLLGESQEGSLVEVMSIWDYDWS
ncbi:MAG: hypothetical protein ACTSQ8_07905 [Candidatus Helarchaeota archaeon]